MGNESTKQFLEILELRGGAWYIFMNSKIKFQKLWSMRKFWTINMEIRLIT